MAETTYEDIERLGENYYEVTVYKYGEEEPVDGFCCYGSVWGIVDMMDSLWLLDAVPHEGWDSYHACISLDGHDLVHMTSMDGPDEWEIIASYDAMVELVAA